MGHNRTLALHKKPARLFAKDFGSDIHCISAFPVPADRSFEKRLNLFDFPVEPEWTPIEVIERNYRAEIHAYIEGFAGGKRRGHGALDRAVANLTTIYFEDDIRGRTGLGDCSFHLNVMLAGG